MVRHKTVAIAKELGNTVKTCLLYLAMSQSNQTYIIEINPFTKEKIYHTYRMTQPNRLVKVEFNPFTKKETNKGADLKLTDFKKFKHHFRQNKPTYQKNWYRNEWAQIKYGYVARLTQPQYTNMNKWNQGIKLSTVRRLAEEIETLLIYLALDKRHFVTLPQFDPNTNQFNKVSCYMSPRGKIFGIKKTNDQKESLGRLDLTFSQLQDIIVYLKEEKPSDQHGGVSRNKWGQIKIEVTLYRMEEKNQQ